MSLFDTRIAEALGWEVSQVQSFSLPALHDLLPEGKLRHEVTLHLQSPRVVLGEKYRVESAARRVQRALEGEESQAARELRRFQLQREQLEREFIELGRRK